MPCLFATPEVRTRSGDSRVYANFESSAFSRLRSRSRCSRACTWSASAGPTSSMDSRAATATPRSFDATSANASYASRQREHSARWWRRRSSSSALSSPTAARAASSSKFSCCGHELKLDFILFPPLFHPCGPNPCWPNSFAESHLQRVHPSVITIPYSGQFFSFHLRYFLQGTAFKMQKFNDSALRGGKRRKGLFNNLFAFDTSLNEFRLDHQRVMAIFINPHMLFVKMAF